MLQYVECTSILIQTHILKLARSELISLLIFTIHYQDEITTSPNYLDYFKFYLRFLRNYLIKLPIFYIEYVRNSHSFLCLINKYFQVSRNELRIIFPGILQSFTLSFMPMFSYFSIVIILSLISQVFVNKRIFHRIQNTYLLLLFYSTKNPPKLMRLFIRKIASQRGLKSTSPCHDRALNTLTHVAPNRPYIS